MKILIFAILIIFGAGIKPIYSQSAHKFDFLNRELISPPDLKEPDWLSSIRHPQRIPGRVRKVNTSSRVLTTSKTPVGYRHEKWNSFIQSFETDTELLLYIENDNKLMAYTRMNGNLNKISDAIMSDDFSNSDLLDFLMPGGTYNEYFLRPVRGSFYGSFLDYEVLEKIDGSFVKTYSANGRMKLPFGFQYQNGYAANTCETGSQVSEYFSDGKMEGNLWVVDIHVFTKSCSQNPILGEWKETLKFDMNFNYVEDLTYVKVNDKFELISHFKREYDEQNREKVFISVLENKKYEFEYDEYGNYLSSGFIWDGISWIQNRRTTREVTNGQEGTICTFTRQNLVNNVWKNGSRDHYEYDLQKRIVSYSVDYYNENGQWDLDHYMKAKYYKENMYSEIEYFFGASLRAKELYSYDERDKLVHSEYYDCSNLAECLQGIYQPLYKFDYHEQLSDTLDYQTSFLYFNNSWHKSDSVANLYDTDGDLVEMYYEDFNIDQRERYRFQYEELITNVTEEKAVQINVYPNPVDHFLTIEPLTHDFQIEVYDITGRMIERYSNPTVIDFSKQIRGIYILNIRIRNQMQRKMVIKR